LFPFPIAKVLIHFNDFWIAFINVVFPCAVWPIQQQSLEMRLQPLSTGRRNYFRSTFHPSLTAWHRLQMAVNGDKKLPVTRIFHRHYKSSRIFMFGGKVLKC